MDSFSGSFPLEFISFCLDMSSEERNDIVPAVATASMAEEEVAIPEEAGTSQATSIPVNAESTQLVPSGDNPDKTVPTPSPSTDESISAYIDRQLQTLGCQGLGLDISFLPSTSTAIVDKAVHSAIEKASESDPIPQVVGEASNQKSSEVDVDPAADIQSETGFSVANADYFQTDTSDNEELLDSSGAETLKEPPFLIDMENLSVVKFPRRLDRRLQLGCLMLRPRSFLALLGLCLLLLGPSSINISAKRIRVSFQSGMPQWPLIRAKYILFCALCPLRPLLHPFIR